MINNIESELSHHWALDHGAAEVLAERIEQYNQSGHIESVIDKLDPTAVAKRDDNREKIGRAFRGESKIRFIANGPCSTDVGVDYGELFDFAEGLQETSPDTVIALRLNGAKPRTGIGWTGLYYGLDPEYRERLFEVYTEAFNRGFPIITEITEGNQLGALAPMLSAAWVGARDIESTALRGKFSAYHLPVGIKNGTTGDLEIVENTIKAIRSNSEDNMNSGVDLGTIASTPDFPGIATGIVPIREGNKETSIFARGYNLPEGMSAEQRRKAAFEYISNTNALGKLMNAAVVIDGTHGVPPMFSIDRKSPDRFVAVLHEIHQGIIEGHIKDADQMIGVMGEVGVVEGRTDPNYVLDDVRKQQLLDLFEVTLELL